MYKFVFDFEYNNETYKATVKYSKGHVDDTIWTIKKDHNIISEAKVTTNRLICVDLDGYHDLYDAAYKALNDAEYNIWEQCKWSSLREESSDPAIKNHVEQIRSFNPRDHEITETYDYTNVNRLNFSNYKLSENEIDILVAADLSCIREIDVSCDAGKGEEMDANRFLTRLFLECNSLRSLMKIKVDQSNVNAATIRILKDEIKFNGPLIRDTQIIGYGGTLAQISVTDIKTTPIMTETNIQEKIKLQRIGENRFEILYRWNDYCPSIDVPLRLTFG